MTPLVLNRDAEVAKIVGARLDRVIVPPYTAMGVLRNGRLTGGIIFSNFNKYDIELTIAGINGAPKGYYKAVAIYIFAQLKCVRVTMTVRSKDLRTIAIARRFGFKIEGVKRRQFGDDDGVIFGMLVSECPWLGAK